MSRLPPQRHLRLEEVQSDLLSLASEVVSADLEIIAYKSAAPFVALIDARRLRHYRFAVDDLAKLRADADVMSCWCAKGSDNDFRQELVRSGRLVQSHLAAKRLGLSRVELAAAVSEQRLFTVDVGPKTYLPAFFLAEKPERSKIEATSQLLRGLPSWSAWEFFTLPKNSLWGYTPLEALRQGLVESVAEAAEAFVERCLDRFMSPWSSP
jgi:hypothetical protein